MTRKIFKNIFLVTFLSVILSLILIITAIYGAFEGRMQEQNKTEALYIADALNRLSDTDAYLQTVAQGKSRITLVAPDGTVLFDDTLSGDSPVDNHLNRPEIQEALELGRGSSERTSSSLREKTFYYALRLENGSVLRISDTRSSIIGILVSLMGYFVIIIVGIAIFALLLARKVSRNIVSPLNELNLDNPLENNTYDEISPLLRRIDKQNELIRGHIQDITLRQKEFDFVVNNMREGLALLDSNLNILSMNTSARKILDCTDVEIEGKSILAVNRSIQIQNMLLKSQQNMPSEETIYINNKLYELYANPFGEDAHSSGTVLFIVSANEKKEAEKLRREFSANVSHELKTPLTSISGYAEIMRDGLADQKDTADFASRIHEEANRLISLVDDIMKLSRLDENSIGENAQRIDLLSLCHDIVSRLEPVFSKKQVTVLVEGEAQYVTGVRQILDEMIFNLLENAIKYNKPEGVVNIHLSKEQGKVIFRISDTGIGIPRDYHDKVFERFYRVDKSHSKDTGGTGLGLAIVKHAAFYHGAEIFLSSQENEGTAIEVHFKDKK